MRRRRRVSMLRAVRSRDAVNASKFDSVSSTGEDEAVRGTTVVVTCSFGAKGERGDAGGRHGVGWAISTAGASGAGRVGKRRRPTPQGRAGRVLGASGIGSGSAIGCSVCEDVRKNVGRRLERGNWAGAATWPFELRRAVIWSREGSGFLFIEGPVAGADLRAASLGKRKSTCSTQGLQGDATGLPS